ncbi:hypothetical protein [Flavobacterium sp. HTF]|uniref:hypothetical protein n=1 Tax=Flavobacterium sp. HTF TaxID=2170732 RepID=UPI000D5E409B|nr:hypothetical protein [Flavobacterium sp. HTF]PWB19382.1 hypothetical protein DCO46_21685 [Flavobacterium sp. HTF]
MKTKHFCQIGLLFFLASYLLFSNILPNLNTSIDFAHWFNLIGACFLLSFNDVFPKNRINTLASVLTALGVIAHIGLCTIDFIMSGFGTDETAKAALSLQISNSPEVLYPFVIVGPSLLFVGLAVHALNFIKTQTIISLMVVLASAAIGFSFFVLKNGVCMFLSCVVFVLGLGLLLFKKEAVLNE